MSFVGDRHRDGAEVGSNLFFRSRQGRPFAPERIARSKVPLLPGHEGAAPQRAVGDDGCRHKQIPARVWARRADQAPARAKAPGDLQQGAGALAARILQARGLVDDQHVKERMIVGDGGELTDQPGHKVDADHRHLSRRSGSEEKPALLGAAVENGDAKVLKVRPRRDFSRPDGRGDELRGDDEGMPAVPIADQFGERREGSSALTSPKRGDQERSIALVKVCCRPLLIATQDAREEGSIHGLPPSAAFAFVYQPQLFSSL
jgi:hypothetical protein